MDLSNGLSNPASLYECNYLSVVTTKRALVYDLRCIGNPLISWELPTSIGIPSKVDLYTFPAFRDETQKQQGDYDGHQGMEMSQDFMDTHTQSSVVDESVGEVGGGERQSGIADMDSKMNIDTGDQLHTQFATQMSQLHIAQSQPRATVVDGSQESDADQLYGSLVVGCLISGYIIQFPFSVTASGIAFSPEVHEFNKKERKVPGRAWKSQQSRVKICSSKFSLDPEHKSELNGFPIRHENVTRAVDVPSYLSLPLKLHRREGAMAGISALRFLKRLKHKYEYKIDLSYRVLDLEIAEWIDVIEYSRDALGAAFVPLLGSYHSLEIGAIVIRENLIGDILIHTCKRQQESPEPKPPKPDVPPRTKFREAQATGKRLIRILKQNRKEHLPRVELRQYVALTNEQGALLNIDVTNSDLRGKEWWKVQVPSSAEWPGGQSAAVRFFSSIPTFLGRRLGDWSKALDPVALNFLLTYLEFKAQMLRNTSSSNEVLESWGLEHGADAWLKDFGLVVTMWDILRKQITTLYDSIQGELTANLPTTFSQLMAFCTTGSYICDHAGFKLQAVASSTRNK